MELEKITQEMMKVITARSEALIKEPTVQVAMLRFTDKDEAINWLYKLAIATLVVPPELRGAN